MPHWWTAEYAVTLLQLAPGVGATSEEREQRRHARAGSPADGNGGGSGSDGEEAGPGSSDEWEDDGCAAAAWL